MVFNFRQVPGSIRPDPSYNQAMALLVTSQRPRALGFFAILLGAAAACGEVDDPIVEPMVDAPAGCDPATALPSNFRPIPNVSAGMVNVTTTGNITAGTVDATAGGLMGAADNPYVYLDLKTGQKVAIHDLDARMSTAWDIALKRASLRVNGGDSGTGERKLVAVPAGSLDMVTAAPTTGYRVDDFADAECAPITHPSGEPMSAFGEWYGYDQNTHMVVPKSEVYVIERPDGSHSALRLLSYYGDPANPMRGAYYRVEWKQL
jgi:hypothetical protein